MRSKSARKIAMALETPASPRGGEPVGISAPDQHGARSQANGLHDITAAAHAAVHQDFARPFTASHNFRQRSQRCGNAVKLAASVIGNNHACGPCVDRRGEHRRRSVRL